MTPRFRPFALLAVLSIAAAVIAACGGGGDDGDSIRPGNLTDPRDVPTATPWDQAPDVVILDPDNIAPLPPVGGQDDDQQGSEATPAPAGECGETYAVISGDTPSGIAEKCGVSTQELLDANPGIDPAGLHIGDLLNIPTLSQ